VGGIVQTGQSQTLSMGDASPGKSRRKFTLQAAVGGLSAPCLASCDSPNNSELALREKDPLWKRQVSVQCPFLLTSTSTQQRNWGEECH
jgi:hypothetical protein